MSMKLKFSDQLRRAIREAPVTRYRISVDTGISEAVLSRFMNHKVGLSMATVDTLCAYLGLRLAPERTERTKGK